LGACAITTLELTIAAPIETTTIANRLLTSNGLRSYSPILKTTIFKFAESFRTRGGHASLELPHVLDASHVRSGLPLSVAGLKSALAQAAPRGLVETPGA